MPVSTSSSLETEASPRVVVSRTSCKCDCTVLCLTTNSTIDSFIYTYEDGKWMISHHHSSLLPEPAVAAIKKVKAMEASS